MRYSMKALWMLVLGIFAVFASPPGRFDSIDGTYDEQTSFAFNPTLYYKALARTWIGKLSRSSMKTSMRDSFGGPRNMDGTACIWKKQISAGDMVRFSLVEALAGLGTYGDVDPARGNHLGYGNLEVRVNEIDSPAVPVPGRNSQRRVRQSLGEIKPLVKERVKDWAAQEMEIQATLGLLCGADASVLASTANGGLYDTLGIKTLGTAGNPLMPRHFYTPQNGYLSYSSTPATWNSTVNTGINGITQGANGRITLNHLRIIRDKLDDISFAPCKIDNKEYKAAFLCHPHLVWRINHLLADLYKYAAPRSNDNQVFGVDHVVAFDDMVFIPVPILKKFNLTYDAVNLCPSWGVGDATDILSSDPRSYTTTSSNALMIGLGAGGLTYGYDDKLWITDAENDHGKGVEYVAHQDMGFKRGEWFPQDGRTDTDACISYGCFAACFYEDGVGQGY